MLAVTQLQVAIGGTRILSEVSVTIGAGERWAVIGQNGAGKSTLVKCMAGLLPASGGEIRLEGQRLAEVGPRQRARRIAYVPQAAGRGVPGFTVVDYVMMGRFPHQGFLAIPSERDRRRVGEALTLTDTDALATRAMNTLSGGELQRVFLAAAVAQESALLLLDEPLSFLDPLHQDIILTALDRIHDRYGTAMVTVTHDVNAALVRSSHILALVAGRVFFAGAAAELRRRAPAVLQEIYSLPFDTAMAGTQALMVPAFYRSREGAA